MNLVASETLKNGIQVFSEIAKKRIQNKCLLVFLDYDGTLSPIVPRPEDAILKEKMKMMLQEIKEMYITSIVTGRKLSNITNVIQMKDLFYAGSHGHDILGPDGTGIREEIGVEYVSQLEEFYQIIGEKLKSYEGTRIENNRFCLTVHYRTIVDQGKISEVKDTIDEELKNFSQLRCALGKKVFEIKPKMEWHKGKAVEYILKILEPHVENPCVLYIGDDTTDEDAFEYLRERCKNEESPNIGLLVTEENRQTHAMYKLHDTNEVELFLQKLLHYGKTENTNAQSIKYLKTLYPN